MLTLAALAVVTSAFNLCVFLSVLLTCNVSISQGRVTFLLRNRNAIKRFKQAYYTEPDSLNSQEWSDRHALAYAWQTWTRAPHADLFFW